ncbi:MAG: NHL repeat-containing protein [Armatimonadetes bacterium]|nr:NHL repeat-containing protein [Armatimonadota bacterium]
MSDRFDYLEIGDERPRPGKAAGVPVPAAPSEGAPTPPAAPRWRVVEVIGGPGRGFGQFNTPLGLAVDAQGNLLVADSGNHRCQRITPAGDVCSIGERGRGKGQCEHPTAVAASRTGEVFVLDAGNARVQVFNAAGQWQREFGRRGAGAAEFRLPAAAAIGPDGSLYIVDAGNRRVARWDPAGSPLGILAHSERLSFYFGNPCGVAVTRTGHIYVADRQRRAVLIFTAGFRLERILGSPKSTIQDPRAVWVDAEGTVFIADGQANRILVLDCDGRLRQAVEKAGPLGPLAEPAGLAAAPDGSIYLSDTGHHRILRMAAAGER